ncbi:MAG: hypothetical protein IT342_25305 [Candidatus Melainabacteria bacterium]|nr:hypothetical protein [Candidatus Melainabacteria bacterium]
MRQYLILAAAAFVALLTGCAHSPEWLRPPQQFQVSVYQAGAQVKSFRDTKDNTSPTSNYELQLAESIEDTYSPADGFSFAIEPTGIPSNVSAVHPTATTKVKVTLSSGGKAVRVWYAEQFSEQYGNVYLQTPGARYCVIVNGEVTVESVDNQGVVIAGQPQSETPRCLLQPK